LKKIILKDFEQNYKKLEELQILKKECDDIRRDFLESNKINKIMMFLARYCLLFDDYEKLFMDFNYKSKYGYFRFKQY
jgi:hypothetical protein